MAIITPYTEKVALLSFMVASHPNGEVFKEKLRLKVFIFDTCQVEERNIIIYSMVANRARDVLNFIFKVEMGVKPASSSSTYRRRWGRY
ncbi:MAG: hypothetical protein RJA34_2466 [Pseudomonadota bacterium]